MSDAVREALDRLHAKARAEAEQAMQSFRENVPGETMVDYSKQTSNDNAQGKISQEDIFKKFRENVPAGTMKEVDQIPAFSNAPDKGIPNPEGLESKELDPQTIENIQAISKGPGNNYLYQQANDNVKPAEVNQPRRENHVDWALARQKEQAEKQGQGLEQTRENEKSHSADKEQSRQMEGPER